MRQLNRDRFGLGFRPELAAAILSHLDSIDVVEVISESVLQAPRAQLSALRTLGAQVPLLLHGVALGLASVSPVEQRRLDAVARLVERLQPEAWSEHIAFVRAGGIELGHLAQPPRTAATVEGCARNLRRAHATIGARPYLENIASLIDPPCSTLDEPAFISAISAGTGCDLLLDLQNLYANACNFGADAETWLARLPLQRVAIVHIAGGKLVRAADGTMRVLDDHLHDVPEPVYALLRELGRRTLQPLTVLLERDGAYPAFERLLAQLQRAREVLAQGRTLAWQAA